MRRSRVTLATIEAAAMAALVPSPPMIARCSRSSGTRKPSDRSSAPGGASRPRSARARAARLARCTPAAIDLAGRRDDHAHARRAGEHGVVELLALGDRARLGVVELRERRAHAALQAAVVEEHGGRDERARERSAPRLVRAGDERHAERAVVAQQAVAGPEELARWALTDGDGHAGERSATIPGPRGRAPPSSHGAHDRAQKKRMRNGGQASPNARPSSWLRGTGPQMRESTEKLRLSPITK